ncbi:pirin family protein, partial [Escherichia coli]
MLKISVCLSYRLYRSEKMKKVIGVYRNQHMHWVGDGFPVK